MPELSVYEVHLFLMNRISMLMTAIAIYFQSPLLKSFPIFPINQKLPGLFPEPEKNIFQMFSLTVAMLVSLY